MVFLFPVSCFPASRQNQYGALCQLTQEGKCKNEKKDENKRLGESGVASRNGKTCNQTRAD
jgi:hypothetical protein